MSDLFSQVVYFFVSIAFLFVIIALFLPKQFSELSNLITNNLGSLILFGILLAMLSLLTGKGRR